MNENENKNGHYRDCGAITDNLSRFFNLIRRSLEFFAFAKNRDDSLLFLASPRTRFSEIATSAFRLLAMTFSTLTIVFFLNLSTALAAKCISNGTNTTGGTIEGTTTACTSCGLNCNWELDGGVLTISASTNPSTGKPYEVTMKDFTPFSAPWNSSRDNITSVNVGDGITSIGQNAFLRATNLTTVTLPDTLTSIKSSAFESAQSLSNITIPDSVESIGHHAFWANRALTSINLPDGITTIEEQVFENSGLTSVTIPASVESIGNSAFYGVKLESITFSDAGNLTTIGQNAFQCFQCPTLESVIIPEGVTTIGYDAFGNSKSITLPSTLTSIGERLSSNGILTSITIPDTLTAENVANWNSDIFKNNYYKDITTINCVKADGSEGGDEKACVAALARFLYDENANCSVGRCLRVEKIGNTCVGYYYGSTANDGTCVTKWSCTGGGNYINTDTRQCMTPASCTGMYVADTVNKKCFKMPGCVNFADGACQECDNGYLTNSSGACIPADDCKNGLHADGGACVENPAGCNTFENDHCTECNGGLLRQGAGCVSSCGEGYKLSNGACYRTHYTPAEAETVSGDTNTITLIYK